MASRIFVVSPLDAGEGPLLHTIPMVFSENHGGPCGIRDHETDWLTLENALPRASLPRSKIER